MVQCAHDSFMNEGIWSLGFAGGRNFNVGGSPESLVVASVVASVFASVVASAVASVVAS